MNWLTILSTVIVGLAIGHALKSNPETTHWTREIAIYIVVGCALSWYSIGKAM